MKKIAKLIQKRERLLAKIDRVSGELKLLHIEFEFLCDLHSLKQKKLN
jgi:hypothetical protein